MGGGVVVDEDEMLVYVVDLKNDRRGVGYDAFAGAEEFCDAVMWWKCEMEWENVGLMCGCVWGEVFGVGVFEEEDEVLYMEDELKLNEYAFEMEEEEEEDELMCDLRVCGKGVVLVFGVVLLNDCFVCGFCVLSDMFVLLKWFVSFVVFRDFRSRVAAILKASMKVSVMVVL